MFFSFVTSISHGTIIFISVNYSVGGATIKAFVWDLVWSRLLWYNVVSFLKNQTAGIWHKYIYIYIYIYHYSLHSEHFSVCLKKCNETKNVIIYPSVYRIQNKCRQCYLILNITDLIKYKQNTVNHNLMILLTFWRRIFFFLTFSTLCI